MNSTEYIRLCLVKRNNMSVAELAEKTGQTRQNLSNKMQRNEWKQAELEKIAAALDADLDIRFIDHATDEPII
ncbi:MAG: helix-turn-helix transcriptional regulator [Treponema sp.]|nr:helix-turn-helix transcriptional regulator [Treponema sp.]